MEQLHHDNQDFIAKLEWYLEHFKKRMSHDMKQLNFEPTATQQHDGYDGVVTELNNNFETLGIDKTEIFTSLEKTNQLLMSCLQSPADWEKLDQDQLTHFLKSSTRRPYHDPFTGDFYPEGRYEVNDVIDSKLLAQCLQQEKEKLEKIQHIEKFLASWREEHIKAIHAHTLSHFGDIYRPKLTALGIKEAYSFQEMEYIIDQYLYKGRKVYRLIRRSPEKVNEHDLQLYEEVKTDPLFSLLSGGTGGAWRESHIFNTEKLSKILLEVNNLNMIKNVIDS